MRILHTSDWHLGKTLCGRSLLEDQAYFLDGLVDTIIDERVGLVVIAGDIYDRSVPPAEAVSLLDDTLWRIVMNLGVPVAAIAGNHDSAQRLSFGGRLLEKNGLYIAGAPGKKISRVSLNDEHGKINLHLLPYFYPQQIRHAFEDDEIKTFSGAFAALMSENPPDTSERNILAAHGLFARLSPDKPADIITSESEVTIGGLDLIDIGAAGGYDYIALGHLHAPQRAGAQTARYSGSPLKYSVSEHNQRKLSLLVDIGAKGCVSIKEIPIKPLRDLRVIRGRFDELMDSQPSPERAADYISAEITDELPVLHAAARLRTVYPNLIELRFPSRAGAEGAVIEKAEKRGTPELFAEFYEYIKGVPISPELARMSAQVAADTSMEDADAPALEVTV